MRLPSLLLLIALFVSQLGFSAWSMAVVPAGEAASFSGDALHLGAEAPLKECGLAEATDCDKAKLCDACQLCQACHPAAIPAASVAGGIQPGARELLRLLTVRYLSADRAPSFKPPIL